MSTTTQPISRNVASCPLPSPKPSYWLWILGLIGLDYFSTLGYQPSIAFEAAGPLAPLATVAVVLITFCGALPVYAYITGKSPHGQGATGLLERLVHGWWEILPVTFSHRKISVFDVCPSRGQGIT